MPDSNNDSSRRPNVFSKLFLESASLRKFASQDLDMLPDDYPQTRAFSSLTHISWNPWMAEIRYDLPSLTHIAVDSCITPTKAADILKKCKRLKVLAVLTCYGTKETLEEIQSDWLEKVGGDRRVVMMGDGPPDPDGIMQNHGHWEVGEEMTRTGWVLQKAWYE